jgi:hypothetical protein
MGVLAEPAVRDINLAVSNRMASRIASGLRLTALLVALGAPAAARTGIEVEGVTFAPAVHSGGQPGDRYALTYLPGVGTELSLNGRPLGTIPGEDFAAALFSIWLGPHPLDDDLKRTLLASR